jgi:hypothetical protein
MVTVERYSRFSLVPFRPLLRLQQPEATGHDPRIIRGAMKIEANLFRRKNPEIKERKKGFRFKEFSIEGSRFYDF